MCIRDRYKKTLLACYLGFVTQAISANFTPLLFLTFKDTYKIGLEKIALIPLVFYLTQLLIDFAATKFVDKMCIRDRAQAEAAQIINEAKETAQNGLNEAKNQASEILSNATTQANEMVASAQQKSKEILMAVNNYADETLLEIDSSLYKALTDVRLSLIHI